MIDSLLYYGYDPSCAESEIPVQIKKSICSQPNRCDSFNDGVVAFENAMKNELYDISNSVEHVVPLSSGLDSRSILAYLINEAEVESITTVTFGSPGTWDYDISQQISKSLNVENIALNLESERFDWSEQSLRKYARSLDCPTRIFEGYVNSQVNELFDDEYVVWSGFLGGESMGSHRPENPCKEWDTACEYFATFNQFTDLVDQQFDPIASLPDEPYLPREVLSYEEQLDFAHRQQCFIRPLIICDPDRYLTPFLQPEWLRFALNLPPEKRRDRSLFVNIMCDLYPDLFSFPTDMKHGLPPNANYIRWRAREIRLYISQMLMDAIGLKFTDPGMNYVNFETMFREDNQLKTTVQSLTNDFNDRVQWDVQQIWNEHQRGVDNSNELRAISSTELYLSEASLS